MAEYPQIFGYIRFSVRAKIQKEFVMKRRSCQLSVVIICIFIQHAFADVYRWDNGELLSTTVPEPRADYAGQMLDYAALDHLDLYYTNFRYADLFI